MCGRVYSFLRREALFRAGRTSNISGSGANNITANYNITPTTPLPSVRSRRAANGGSSQYEAIEESITIDNPDPDREIVMMRWGMDTPTLFIVNGRIEEVQEKWTFKPLLSKNRCVIIVSGYFEWDKEKNPYVFCNSDEKNDRLLIAGLYDKNDNVIIMTCDASAETSVVHHRMPVLLDDAAAAEWLNPDSPFGQIIDSKILSNTNTGLKNVKFYRCAPHVNTIKEKSQKCLMKHEDYIKELDKNGIKKFFTVSTKKDSTPANTKVEKTNIAIEIKGQDPHSKMFPSGAKVKVPDAIKEDSLKLKGAKVKLNPEDKHEEILEKAFQEFINN